MLPETCHDLTHTALLVIFYISFDFWRSAKYPIAFHHLLIHTWFVAVRSVNTAVVISRSFLNGHAWLISSCIFS